MGGTHSDQPREITPQTISVGKEGMLVESLCCIANATRHFYLHKITRIEDYNWAAANIAGLCCILKVFVLGANNSLADLPASVEQWLVQLKLDCYWDDFKKNGFDRLDTLKFLDKPALVALGIPLGHQSLLLHKANKIVVHIK